VDAAIGESSGMRPKSELSADVADLATEIRARHRSKTPDALHATCCLQLGQDHIFVTGDSAFRRVSGLNVRVLA
jgi:predicted nucleic acid-binding protein